MRFALVGFGFGILGGISLASSDISVFAVSVLVCPAVLVCMPLFAMAFEAFEFGTPGFYLGWGLVALINAVLYLLIGAAYVGLLKKPDSKRTS
jgi:hypothetical protein